MMYTFPDGTISITAAWGPGELSVKARVFHQAMCHLFDHYATDGSDAEKLGCIYYDLIQFPRRKED